MNNQNDTVVKDPRKTAQEKYNTARVSLLLLIVLTVVNLVLFAIGSETMMLFSATVPYYAVIIASVLENSVILIGAVCIAAVCIIAYLICWIASKKNYAWLIVALVMFIIDTLGLVGISLLLGDFSGIIDFVIHAWIIYELVSGVVNGSKLKKMPEFRVIENAQVEGEEVVAEDQSDIYANSAASDETSGTEE